MDAFEERQNHEYGTCLCFSVMGRRKFRISMCAIKASPEAGDASTSIISAKRKYSVISDMENPKNILLLRRNKNMIDQCTSTISTNSIKIIKDNVYDEFATTQGDLLRKTIDIERKAEYCGFPYYRSNRTDGFQDAVLIKDIGVSCNFLNENAIIPDISISGIENYLIKQLKFEYNELSSITRKINAYTKDILSSLALRSRRKDQVLQKLHVASKNLIVSQYADKTANACLTLRFHDDMERKSLLSEVDLNKNFAEKKIVREKIHGNKNIKKRCVELDNAFREEFLDLSPKYGGVLLRNYLITKREKIFGNTLKASLRKTENITSSDRLCNDRSADKSCKSFYTSKCNPLMLTNWREVSRSKDKYKSTFTASTSGES